MASGGSEGRRATVHDLLAAARRGLERLGPHEAAAALGRGAVLIDVRTAEQRAADGELPGAVALSLNVLEWRVDPASAHRDPRIGGGLDAHLVVVCDEGYCSSLAAARLRALGFACATDLAGGFRAWRAAGLPVLPPAAAGEAGAPLPGGGGGRTAR